MHVCTTFVCLLNLFTVCAPRFAVLAFRVGDDGWWWWWGCWGWWVWWVAARHGRGPPYTRPAVLDMASFREGAAPMFKDPVTDAAVGRGHVLAITQSGARRSAGLL
jgi:hypothetical protein